MKTKRLISSITYNSDMYLAVKLQELVRARVIEYAHWIRHRPEKDELKSHFHVLVQPCSSLDTCSFSILFNEVDPTDTSKTLGCMPWRFSKFEDWILYSIHDRAYLSSKHLERNEHYTIQDVSSTHPDMLLEDYKRIDLRCYGVGACLSDAIAHGRSWESVVASGLVPSTNWRYWKEVFSAMGGTFRIGSGAPIVRDSVLSSCYESL